VTGPGVPGPPAPAATRTRGAAGAALAVVYLVWGSTYLAIRVAVRHLPPLLMAGCRYVLAGLLLYPLSLTLARGDDRRRPTGRQWVAAGVVGVLLLFAGNGGVSVAETTIPSGLAALLVATVPLWMAGFGRVVSGSPVRRSTWVGLLVGIGGVVLLTGPAAGHHLTGVLIVLGAALCWAFGSVIANRLPLHRRLSTASGMEMLVGGVVLVVVGSLVGEWSRFHAQHVTLTSLLAFLYLIGPGAILAFTCYGYALRHLPATVVSTYAYVNPVIAVFLGAAVLGEHLSTVELVGAALIVAGVALTVRTRAVTHQPPGDDRRVTASSPSRAE
jgi:drug/metabolite transporter (DMT)-like permease